MGDRVETLGPRGVVVCSDQCVGGARGWSRAGRGRGPERCVQLIVSHRRWGMVGLGRRVPVR
eukprot:1731486-Prymnesium_polylepis.1